MLSQPSTAAPECVSQVSKAARQEKRFQDYNERCTFHHQARVRRGVGDGKAGREPRSESMGAVLKRCVCMCCADPPSSAQEFAVNLWNRVSAIHEVPPPKSFTFLSDACRGLEQARKVGGRGEQGRCQGDWWAGQLSSDPFRWRGGGGSRWEVGASPQPGGMTWAPLGAGLCLRVQLLQPGNGANGRGGAAD